MFAAEPQALELTGVEAAPATRSRAPSQLIEWLAVGGGSLLLFPLSWLLRVQLGLDEAEYAVGATMFYAAHFLNDPHFAVTYLLFYRGFGARVRSDEHGVAYRTRYAIAGVLVPLVLSAWAACALLFASAQTLGFMVQLMFLLVGWHYAKQGFGVLTVLSARRGVRFSARERRVVLSHCFAAWAFASAHPARAAGQFEEKGVVYWGPAHPGWLELATGSVFALTALALVAVLGKKWRDEGSLPFTPLLGFLVTIWLWTIYTGIDPLVRYAIPALHSIQYMYFVWLLKRNEACAEEGPPLFGPPAATRLATLALSSLALGFALFRGIPPWLDDTWTASSSTNLGATPFFAAIFAIVNIHHYFMDNVIWRRDNPETRFMLTDPQAS